MADVEHYVVSARVPKKDGDVLKANGKRFDRPLSAEIRIAVREYAQRLRESA